MNDTFSFARFNTYFLYDLKQMWRRNSRAILLIGFASVILYLVYVTLSLIFSHTWHAPGLMARGIVFYVAALALMFYQTRTYGYLTERRAGSSWLMIPASATEKFVSMMLITLVVLPVAFAVVYLATDALIVLLDPTASQPLISSISELSSQFSTAWANSGAPEALSLNIMILPILLQFVTNFLYYLLCGISFKRWKLVSALAVLIGLQFVLTSIIGIVSTQPATMEWLEAHFADANMAGQSLTTLFHWIDGINAAIALGLGAGIFYRIKNLKH